MTVCSEIGKIILLAKLSGYMICFSMYQGFESLQVALAQMTCTNEQQVG